MANKEAPAAPAPATAARTTKVRLFKAPDELPAKFNVQAQTDSVLFGVVATEDVRELLDAFGLQHRNDVTFPFQHIKKAHGEQWQMRIENDAVHQVDSKHLKGHQWVYSQQIPETTGTAQ